MQACGAVVGRTNVLEGKLAEIYVKLWHMSDHAERPVRVRYVRGGFVNVVDGASALFFTDLDSRPHPGIWVRRERVPAESSKPDLEGASLGELITLAHERGHEQSWRDATYRAMTMEEEKRAWTLAEQLLQGLGFFELDTTDAFERHRDYSLERHLAAGTPE